MFSCCFLLIVTDHHGRQQTCGLQVGRIGRVVMKMKYPGAEGLMGQGV